MGVFDRIKNYWFPVINPLVDGGQGVSRTEDPKHLERYIAKVQLQRTRQNIGTWRDAINEAEQAFYPHRVKMQRLFIDTVTNGHVKACMEKRKALTMQKEFNIVNEKGEVDEFWTAKYRTYNTQLINNYILDALFYGYQLLNFDEIKNDSFSTPRIIKRHNISPDREQVVSYVYSLSGIQFMQEEDYNDWIIWCTTPSENGISKCGYGLLYPVAYYEIFIRNLMGYNGDFVELFSAPFRMAKTHKTSELDRGELEKMLANLGNAGYGVFDPEDDVSLLETKNAGTGWMGYENLEKRCEQKISKILLGHADAIDSTTGKLGANQEVLEAIKIVEVHDNKYVEEIWNEQILPKLRKHGVSIPENLRFQFSNNKEKEEFRLKEDESNKRTADIVKTLTDSGFQVDENWITERTGIPLSKAEPQNNQEPSIKQALNQLYGGI